MVAPYGWRSGVRPDVAGEPLERGDHAGEIPVARFQEDVAHSERLEATEVLDDLVRRALQNLAIGAARARSHGEAGAQRGRELLEGAALPRAFLAQLGEARGEPVGRGKCRVPAVR